ncbi:hypothetical protein AC792_09825 [Arthrobacter sp. RIT-PI-e]|uniref:DUF4040 family protein n=1 Tax=Arthrobacter sp. RIT-PI-e TaxID=1681197 RepID=UPI0006763D72|nr:DUF4040 family protein [Arthrobacter sp. RIT-PI-e]KNC18850.1 hypothetical protein AC792_09825 [Arthrobacter sp. RIT-PI-e]
MTLLILLVSTFLTACLGVVGAQAMRRDVGWIAAGALAVLGVLAATTLSDLGGMREEAIPWIPTLDIALRVRMDGLAMLFVFLVLFIGALVMAYSARYLAKGVTHADYFGWMLLFAFAMVGLVVADDVVLMFVFWELTTLCSFFLLNRSGPKAGPVAVRTLLITASGGLCLLFAVILIITTTGTTELSAALVSDAWADDPTALTASAVLVAVAAMTKSAQFPFHMWLPDAMVAPTPVSAYLHAAAMVKAGIYLLMRFTPLFGDNTVWQVLLVTVGLVTALMGALFALQRHDLKAIMAYSTVSQLGFLVAVIGLGTPDALKAAAVHTLAHALFKSTLFMTVGIIDHQTGTRDLRGLYRLRRVMPVTMIITILAALSMAGVIPLLGFISKETIFAAFIDAPHRGLPAVLATSAAVAVATLTFAYSCRIVLGGFWNYRGVEDPRLRGPAGEHHDPEQKPAEASALFLIPAALPAVAGLVLGLFAGHLDPLIQGATQAATGSYHDPDLTLWHGLTPELGLSVLVLVTGVVLVVFRAPIDQWLNRELLPFTGVGIIESLRRGAISTGTRVGDLTRTDKQYVHLGAPWILLAALGIGAVVSAPVLSAQVEGLDQTSDWVLLAMIALFLLGAVTTHSRLTALLLVGAAGYVVSIWFITLGAVDVGMTQILVEILTAVVLVLALRKLPRNFHKTRRTRAAVSAAAALGTGVLAFGAAFALTGRRDVSALGQYYLENTYQDTGGTNIVAAILVDYRALDTLGELTVVTMAALAIIAVLTSRRSLDEHVNDFRQWNQSALIDHVDNTLPTRTLFRWLAPLIGIFSLYLLVRGHYEPGGGFIAALVAGTALCLAYLGAPTDRESPTRLPYRTIMAAGIAIATLIGATGWVNGSFLRPLYVEVPLPFGMSFDLTSTLIFDIGVYLAVVGLVLVALNYLGQAPRHSAGPQEEDALRPAAEAEKEGSS